jgi:hypothetical protein
VYCDVIVWVLGGGLTSRFLIRSCHILLQIAFLFTLKPIRAVVYFGSFGDPVDIFPMVGYLILAEVYLF